MRYINYNIKSNLMWTRSTYWIFLVILATSSCNQTNPVDLDECIANNATCVNIHDCPFAVALAANKKHAEIVQCGWDGALTKVCCPKNPIEELTTTRSDEGIGGLSVKIEPFAYRDRSLCGKVAVGIFERIYGGTILSPEEFPWIVRLQRQIYKMNVYYCAGSLITSTHVLTAAHCLYGIDLVSARLGEWNEKTDPDCVETATGETRCIRSPIDVGIKNKTVHPAYDPEKFRNDIGIVQLDRPVLYSDFIRPICLPTSIYIQRQAYSPDMKYETAGWGTTETGLPSAIKRKVSLSTVPHGLCRKILTDADDEDKIICAGGMKNKDSCTGDSGGPLVSSLSENDVNNFFLFGITSNGPKKCGREGVPAVYTRVSNFMDWIETTLETMST